jgi:hypothetical protein
MALSGDKPLVWRRLLDIGSAVVVLTDSPKGHVTLLHLPPQQTRALITRAPPPRPEGHWWSG